MHNKYATFVLPVLAGLAIVGAGFSTWVFSNSTTTTATATGTITVESVSTTGAPAGTVTLGYGTTGSNATSLSANLGNSTAFGITLDQGGVSNATEVSSGITVTANHESYDFMWTLSQADATAYSNYKVTVKYSVSATFDEGVDSYIAFAGAKDDQTTSFANTQVTSSGMTLVVPDAINNSWYYVSKPTNKTAYDSMNASCSGKGAKITLTVSVSYTL